MSERLVTHGTNLGQTIDNYYLNSQPGYSGKLNGRCHYGYTPWGSRERFNLETAQIEMERVLGKTLGLPSGARVLDAGCGWSPVARTMTEEFGYKVEGIDLLRRRLQRGSRINEERGVQIGQVNADYHQIPFDREVFDGVYTMETFVHAASYRQVLGEFWRVLKPGGSLALFEYTIPDLDQVPVVPRNLAQRVIKNTGMAALPHFTHGSFPGILERAGFDDIHVSDISKNVHPSWFHLWKFGIRNACAEFAKGNISLDSIPGSAYIWPARRQLKYVVCQAKKPE